MSNDREREQSGPMSDANDDADRERPRTGTSTTSDVDGMRQTLFGQGGNDDESGDEAEASASPPAAECVDSRRVNRRAGPLYGPDGLCPDKICFRAKARYGRDVPGFFIASTQSVFIHFLINGRCRAVRSPTSLRIGTTADMART